MIKSYPSHDYRSTVKSFYEQEDEQWHKEIHKNGESCAANVESTVDTFSKESIMFEIFFGEELAAFFVHYADPELKYLEGFHIAKKFRNAGFFLIFWKIVKDSFAGPFRTGVLEKNHDAVEHLLKQGFEIVAEGELDGEKMLFLDYIPVEVQTQTE